MTRTPAADLFVTPKAVVVPLLDELAPLLGDEPYVVDAGAGSGALSQAVLDRFPKAWVDAAELREIHRNALQAVRGPEFPSAATGRPHQAQIVRIHWGDFLTTTPEWEWWMTKDQLPYTPDLVIANPPFSLAEAFVRRALDVGHEGLVAFLLRLAFVESLERYEFWRAHPPAAIRFLVERPSFTTPDYVEDVQQPDLFGDVHDIGPRSGATDLAAYAWFVWRGENYADEDLPLAPFDWYRWKT